MKYNLKNRPKSFDYSWKKTKEFEDWFEGFEKELREMLKFDDVLYGVTGAEVIKEILGE